MLVQLVWSSQGPLVVVSSVVVSLVRSGAPQKVVTSMSLVSYMVIVSGNVTLSVAAVVRVSLYDPKHLK